MCSKLSLITMVCWMFVCKGVFINSDQNYHHRRFYTHFGEDMQQMQNYDSNFEDTIASLNEKQTTIEET